LAPCAEADSYIFQERHWDRPNPVLVFAAIAEVICRNPRRHLVPLDGACLHFVPRCCEAGLLEVLGHPTDDFPRPRAENVDTNVWFDHFIKRDQIWCLRKGQETRNEGDNNNAGAHRSAPAEP
jgi:hypothetical protein